MQLNLQKNLLALINNRLLLLFFSVSFTVYYFVIALNIRPASDDYIVMYQLTRGWKEALLYNYTKANGRMFAAVGYHLFFWLSGGFKHFIVVSISFFTLLYCFAVYTFYRFWKSIIYRVSTMHFSFLQLLPTAVCSTAVLFFSFVNLSETWLWCDAAFVYIISVLAGMLGLAILLDNQKSQPLLAFICFAYAGNSNEMMALILIATLSLFLIIERKIITQNRSLLFALITLFIFFIIDYSIPGSRTHINNSFNLPQPVFNKHTLVPTRFYEGRSLLKWITNKRSLFFLIVSLLIPVSILGLLKKEMINISILKKITRYSGFAAAIGFLVTVFFFIYISGNTNLGPERAWAAFALCFSVFIMLLAFFLMSFSSDNYLNVSSKVIPLFAGLIILLNTIRTAPAVKEYSKSYDARISYLENLAKENCRDTVPLTTLPPSGVLMDGSITSDPNDRLNYSVQKIIGVPCHIKEVRSK